MTKAQQKAMKLISQPGGHGIGEFSGIRKSTAKCLEKQGRIVIGYHRSISGKIWTWAWTAETPEKEKEDRSEDL